jgi:glycerophosphoryl diester phosphodiesterase
MALHPFLHRLTGPVALLLLISGICDANPFITGRTESIAHRGGAGPENSVVAVQKSVEFEIPFVELDVRLTRDGQAVLLHDATVDRTTNGKGLIANWNFAEVRRLDAGSSYEDATILKRHYVGEKIATPAEIIDAVGQRAVVLLELKVGRSAGPVIEAIRKAQAFERVVVVTSDTAVAWHLKRFDTRVQIGLQCSMPDADLARFVDDLKQRGIVVYTPLDWDALTFSMVKQFHDAEIAVWAGTTNRPDEMAQLTSFGVDGIFTDLPLVLKQVIRDTQGNLPPSVNRRSRFALPTSSTDPFIRPSASLKAARSSQSTTTPTKLEKNCCCADQPMAVDHGVDPFPFLPRHTVPFIRAL